MVKEKNVGRFNQDVAGTGGYTYTQKDRVSSRVANARMSDCVASLADFKGKRVLDLGCGDGTYTSELLKLGVAEIVGVDAAAVAIKEAKRRHRGMKKIRFEVMDVYKAKPLKKRYDIMVIRGVLHHLYDVETAIKAISGLARTIIVVEPNGYNPVLKIIEKTSRYHIEHEEKSYAPHKLDGWFEARGGRVEASRFIGLVPMFFPAWAVGLFKAIEPVVEAIPFLKQIACGQYVQKITIP